MHARPSPLTPYAVLGLPSPIPIPNLQRLYFKFGAPIDLATLNLVDPEQCQYEYDGVKVQVQQVSLCVIKERRWAGVDTLLCLHGGGQVEGG